MDANFPNIGRCLSIQDRLMKMYYDRGLSDFEIGWRQQFYAEHLYGHSGASAQEMVEWIRVDQAALPHHFWTNRNKKISHFFGDQKHGTNCSIPTDPW